MKSRPFNTGDEPTNRPIPIRQYENGPPPPRPRPTKYNEDLHCDQLAADMAQGLSFAACCGALGISVSTGQRWCEQHKEFKEARELGEAAGQYFWEKKGIDSLVLFEGSKFNGTVWVFTMKNRFGWRDKREISGSLDVAGGAAVEQFKHMTAGQLEDAMRDMVGRLPAHMQKVAPERLQKPGKSDQKGKK